MKTKALISCAVTAQLICVFVFAYAKNLFSNDEAQIELLSVSINPFGIKYTWKLITPFTYPYTESYSKHTHSNLRMMVGNNPTENRNTLGKTEQRSI